MACGRPKNLEIAGGNPLCGPQHRRRNFLTTGNGSRRRGNPEPLAKGETPEPPGNGRPRVTARGHPEPPAKRKLSATRRGGKPRATRQRAFRASGAGSLEPPGTGENLGPLARGGTLSHGGEELCAACAGATPSRRQRRKLEATRQRETLAAGNPGNRNTSQATGPGRRLSGTKDAEQSAGRCRETRRGRCISYMQRPRPIVPDPAKSRSYRHAASPGGHSWTRLRGGHRLAAPGMHPLWQPGQSFVLDAAITTNGGRTSGGRQPKRWRPVTPSAGGRRQARPPATPRRPAGRRAGKPGTRATARRAGPGPRGRRG